MRNDFIHMLRGMAALAVATYHVFRHAHDPQPALAMARTVTDFGWLGVPVFFVISGFVISNSLRTAWITPHYAGRYVLRRMLRLDPPYWVAIAAAVSYAAALSVLVHEPLRFPSWQNLVAHVFYLQGLLRLPHLSVGLWTLCLEVQFYLSMLLIVALTQRARIPLAIFIAALGAGSLLLTPNIDFHPPTLWNDGYRSLIPNFSMFAVGILAWLVVTERIDRRWWIAVTAVVAIRLGWWFEWGILAALLTGNAIVLHSLGWLRVPTMRPLMFLGTLSYSLYLCHMLTAQVFLLALRKTTGITGDRTLLACCMAVLLAILVAYAMYWLVERPSMAWSESLKEKRESPIASGHAAKTEPDALAV